MFLPGGHGSGSVNWKKNLIVLWIGVFLGCASFTACIPFLPVYLLTELQVPQDQVNFWAGLAFAATFMAATVMAPYWGAWADRVGQRKMAIRASLGLATTYMLGALVQTAPQLLCVRFLTGLISGFIPASMSLVSSTLPKDKLGWGMGWMQAAIASGNILGPLLGGYLSAWFGMRTSFFAGSGCLFFVSLMVIFLVRDIPIGKETARQEMHIVRDMKLALQNRGLLYVMFMFFLVQTCIMIIQPLITRFARSLMEEKDLYDSTVVLLPRHATWINYKYVADLTGFPGTMITTLWISLVVSVCQVVAATLVSYGFARFEFPLKKFWFACVVMLIIIPPQTISPALYMTLGIFLPLIAVNCAILGGSLFMQERNFPTVAHSLAYALGSGIGWLLAITAFATIRERLKYAKIPPKLQGNGIAYIITGLLGMGFMAFLGM